MSGVSRFGLARIAALFAGLALVQPALAQTPPAKTSRPLPIEAAAARLARLVPPQPGQPRIVDGAQAIPGSYPFQVALILSNAPAGNEFAGFFCGGTLIGERHVLTASHCFLSDGVDTAVAADVHVYLGHTGFRGGERIPVTRLTRHPHWNAEKLVNDIAILELAHAPAAGTRAGLIPVATRSAPAETAKVIGWGALNPGGQSSRYLRETRLAVVDRKTCDSTHASYREKQSRAIISEVVNMIGLAKTAEDRIIKVIAEGAESPVGENVICAGADIGQRSACFGDSGGPLFAEAEDGTPTQIGVVSWGVGCSTREVDGVFTDVARYGDWLRAEMK